MKSPAEKKPARKSDTYFRDRYDLLYYQYMFYIARVVGRDAQSVLDVGSNRCDYIDWLWWIPTRTSLDLNAPHEGPGVRAIRQDFLTWVPDRAYDLVLCLQTLEHIPEVAAFSRKLLKTGRHLIVSVPFEWPEGTQYHVNDPVTREKLDGWMQRPPNYAQVVDEPFPSSDGKSRRLIAYYDTADPERRPGRDDRLQRRPRLPPADTSGATDIPREPMP